MAPAHFVDAVAAHYEREDGMCVKPAPIVIVNELQHIASGVDDVATSARKLLTHIRCGWIASLGATELEFVPCPVVGSKGILRPTTNATRRDAAMADLVERFVTEPLMHQWFATAVERERDRLDAPFRVHLANACAKLRDVAPPHIMALIGTAIVRDMTDDVNASILELATRSEPMWRAFVVDAVARAAEHGAKDTLWTRAVEQLLTWAEDTALADNARLNAMLFGFQRVGERRLNAQRRAHRLRLDQQPMDERTATSPTLCDDLLKRIANTATAPPFAKHSGIQTELRRLRLRP
jgi:hypothetical protein